MDSEKYVFSEEEDDGDDEDSNDTDHEKNELPQPAYVDEQCLGPALWVLLEVIMVKKSSKASFKSWQVLEQVVVVQLQI